LLFFGLRQTLGPVLDAVKLTGKSSDLDVTKIELNDRNEQAQGGPLFFRRPIGFGSSPSVSHYISPCRIELHIKSSSLASEI
jgi:hypothetical protein